MSFNLFGPATKASIRVGYVDPDRGYVSDVNLHEANVYAQLNPGTTFIFKTRDKIRYLNINEVNALTPDDLLPEKSSSESCEGVTGLDIYGDNPVTFNSAGAGTGAGTGAGAGAGTGVGQVIPGTDGTVAPGGNQVLTNIKPEVFEKRNPRVIFGGGGGVGAFANPVFGQDGSLLAVDLVDGGWGYQYPPVTKVLDPYGIGAGAVVRSILVGDPEYPDCTFVTTVEVFDKEEDFEEYDLTSFAPPETSFGRRYDPGGKDIGEWDPTLYANLENNPIRLEIQRYQDFLQLLNGGTGVDVNSSTIYNWWTARKEVPLSVTSSTKTTRNVHNVVYYGNEGLRSMVGFDYSQGNQDNEGIFFGYEVDYPKAKREGFTDSEIRYYLENDFPGLLGPKMQQVLSDPNWGPLPDRKSGWNDFMNQYAISPVPPSNVPGSDFAGIPFTIEWEEDFPYKGDYTFKGLCDNKATLYLDNQKLGDLQNFNASPQSIKKNVESGVHRIRVDLLNLPIKEKVVEQVITEGCTSNEITFTVSTSAAYGNRILIPELNIDIGKLYGEPNINEKITRTVEFGKEYDVTITSNSKRVINSMIGFDYSQGNGDNAGVYFGYEVDYPKARAEGFTDIDIRYYLENDFPGLIGPKMQKVLSDPNWGAIPTGGNNDRNVRLRNKGESVIETEDATDEDWTDLIVSASCGKFIKISGNKCKFVATERPKPNYSSSNSEEITKVVFNTVDYIDKADRQLWRIDPGAGRDSGFLNQYGILPYDPQSNEAQKEGYPGTHVIRWEYIDFPVDGNYNIEVMVDDNVVIYIGNRDGGGRVEIGNGLTSVEDGGDEVIIDKKGFSGPGASTGKSTYTKFFQAGKYRIRAELEQSNVGPLARGNPMALGINISSALVTKEVISARSWNQNPMGVALTIDAPFPPIPQEPKPISPGRCPNNPIWTTRFPNAKDQWYPVTFTQNPGGDIWSDFMNRYAMSPVPPLSTPGSDRGGVVFKNEWNVEIPYNGFYGLKSTVDNAGRILIDNIPVMQANYIPTYLTNSVGGDGPLRKSGVEDIEGGLIYNWRENDPKVKKIYLEEGLHKITVEVENGITNTFETIDQTVFSTKDWLAPVSQGPKFEDVTFKISSSAQYANSIEMVGQFSFAKEFGGPQLNETVTRNLEVGVVYDVILTSNSKKSIKSMIGFDYSQGNQDNEGIYFGYEVDYPKAKSEGFSDSDVRYYLENDFPGLIGPKMQQVLSDPNWGVIPTGNNNRNIVLRNRGEQVIEMEDATDQDFTDIIASCSVGKFYDLNGNKCKFTIPPTQSTGIKAGTVGGNVILSGIKSMVGFDYSPGNNDNNGVYFGYEVDYPNAKAQGFSDSDIRYYLENDFPGLIGPKMKEVLSNPNWGVIPTSSANGDNTSRAKGVVYEGPTEIANYGGDFISPRFQDVNAFPNEEIQGRSWVFRWSNVDFPKTGRYKISGAVDDSAIIRVDGEKVGEITLDQNVVGSASNFIEFNASSGRRVVEIELTNLRFANTGFEQNPTRVKIDITTEVSVATGLSRPWSTNPMGISAILIPPPCPKEVVGKGRICKVIVDDPGNGYPAVAPDEGQTYPTALRLVDIEVANSGINYNCGVDEIKVTPSNGIELSYECDTFGRITKVNVDTPALGYTTYPEITMPSLTGVNAQFTPVFEVVRDPIIDPDKLIQVTDLVGLKQTGYYRGRPYYGAVFYKDGIRYAGFYETPGQLVQIYDTLQESIDAEVTTPPSAIQRQGTDIRSNDPRLNIPGTPENLI